MAVSELDPVFIKALKLLHSKNKDAADQLKELLDDVLAQRKKQKELDNEEKSDERSSKKYGSRKDLEKKEKEPEKRHLDQLSRDLAELSQDSAPVKRQKTEHTSFSGETVKKEERKRVREYKGSDSDDDVERVNETESKVPVVINDESDTGSDNELDAAAQRADDSIQKSPTDIDSFIIDQGLACVICKSFGVTSNNQLVECQECHSLYHQECHNPPPPKNINDPRFVWYCSQCTKTIKKSVPKPPVKVKLVSSSTKESSSSSMKMPPSKSDSNLLNLQPFKRTEAVKMTSSNSVTTGSAMGLAGLAEKLHSKSASTSSEPSKQSKSSTDSQQQPAKTSSSSSKSSSSSTADPTGIGALFKPDPVKVVTSKASAPASQASTVKSQSVLSGGSGSSKQAERTSSSSSTTAKPASSTSSQARGPGQSITSATSTLTSSSKSPSLSSLSGSASAGGDKKTATLTATTVDAADKRLQLMKKKAAVAAQSKKNLIK